MSPVEQLRDSAEVRNHRPKHLAKMNILIEKMRERIVYLPAENVVNAG